MGPGDFLKVKYEGRNVKQRDGSVIYDDHTPYDFRWDSRVYKAAPGKETFVPFEAVAISLGDPRSGETVASLRDEAGNISFVLDRQTELRRLVVLYDNEMDDNDLPFYAPKAVVTDLEGDIVTTVLDDPAGDSVIPAQTTVLDREQLLMQIQRQQRLIEQLAEEQGVDLPDEPSDPSDPTTTTTEPIDDVPEG